MYGVFVCDMKSPFSVLGPSRPGRVLPYIGYNYGYVPRNSVWFFEVLGP